MKIKTMRTIRCNYCKDEKNENEFYKGNPYKCKDCFKSYYQQNKDTIIERQTEYYNQNKEQLQEYSREYGNKQMKEIGNRLYKNITARMYGVTKDIELELSYSELLGCSKTEFKEYIKDKLKDGMTWGNYGKWELDHIEPIIAFNLTDVEQRKECFHYTNIQPLWKNEHIEKSLKEWENYDTSIPENTKTARSIN